MVALLDGLINGSSSYSQSFACSLKCWLVCSVKGDRPKHTSAAHTLSSVTWGKSGFSVNNKLREERYWKRHSTVQKEGNFVGNKTTADERGMWLLQVVSYSGPGLLSSAFQSAVLSNRGQGIHRRLNAGKKEAGLCSSFAYSHSTFSRGSMYSFLFRVL